MTPQAGQAIMGHKSGMVIFAVKRDISLLQASPQAAIDSLGDLDATDRKKVTDRPWHVVVPLLRLF
jgi:hypothetical protein